MGLVDMDFTIEKSIKDRIKSPAQVELDTFNKHKKEIDHVLARMAMLFDNKIPDVWVIGPLLVGNDFKGMKESRKAYARAAPHFCTLLEEKGWGPVGFRITKWWFCKPRLKLFSNQSLYTE